MDLVLNQVSSGLAVMDPWEPVCCPNWRYATCIRRDEAYSLVLESYVFGFGNHNQNMGYFHPTSESNLSVVLESIVPPLKWSENTPGPSNDFRFFLKTQKWLCFFIVMGSLTPIWIMVLCYSFVKWEFKRQNGMFCAKKIINQPTTLHPGQGSFDTSRASSAALWPRPADRSADWVADGQWSWALGQGGESNPVRWVVGACVHEMVHCEPRTCDPFSQPESKFGYFELLWEELRFVPFGGPMVSKI